MAAITYTRCLVNVVSVRPASIMVAGADSWIAIPRSLLHGGDDLKLDRGVDPNVKTVLRIASWKAAALNLEKAP